MAGLQSKPIALLAAALVSGAGCGGPTVDRAVAAASPTAAAAAGRDGACGLPDFQTEALRRINARRAAGASCGARGSFAAAPAVAWHPALADAAYAHSVDMARRGYFEHLSPEGRTPGARVDAAGYAWSSVGENIAGGQRSVQAVVDGWMGSDEHCANLMSPRFRDVGLACVRSSGGSPYRSYWTLELARPQ